MQRSPAAFAAAAVALTMLVAAAVASSSAADAHSYKQGDIAVGHIWAKPAENGADGVAVYAPILNSGKTAIHLLGATSPDAEQARLRKVAKDGTVTWPKEITIEPGKPFSLASWHEHLWVSGLKKPLKQGDWLKLTLDFGDKGKLPVEARVETSPGH